MHANIGGFTAPGFSRVLEAFEQNFTARGEVGAAVTVYVGDEKVVELWGGVRDQADRVPWTADTLGIVFSATKGIAATAMLMLVDRGELDLDAPVAAYWPAFARDGKAGIRVRQLLNHTSGLTALDRPLTLDDVEGWGTGAAPQGVVDAMEAQVPLWEPGTAQGYNAVSYGFYVGELFRRITGQDLGAFVRSEIAEPLGADIHLGLAASDEDRVSTLYPTTPRTLFRHILPRALASRSVEGRLYRQFLQRSSPTRRAFANPAELGLRGVHNFASRRVRALPLPWASGVASAAGLARMYQGLGAGLVGPATLDAVKARQSWAWDKVLCKPMGFSQGFVKDELHLYSPNPHTFGHPGAGGALGYLDPDAHIAFGYVMNRMDFRLRSPRALALSRAVYRSL